MKPEYTLQDCINAFNAHVGTGLQSMFVRRMENLSEWRTASKYWRRIHCISTNSEYNESQARACEMIADATEQGDAYREATAHLSDWVDKTVEAGIMNNDEAIKVIYPEMNKIYNQYFCNK